jgi:hypothetical protein
MSGYSHDELHWTRPSQTGTSCARIATRPTKTTIHPRTLPDPLGGNQLGCEACHGPGAIWVGKVEPAGSLRKMMAPKSLTARLDERRGITWCGAASGNAVRSQPRATERESNCAAVSFAAQQLAEDQTGKPLFDHYRPALLTPPLPCDGQRGEVYNWGSFLQAGMRRRHLQRLPQPSAESCGRKAIRFAPPSAE